MSWLILAGALLAFAGSNASDSRVEKFEFVKSRLDATLLAIAQRDDIGSSLAMLEEAGAALKFANPKTCSDLFTNLFATIQASPDILPSAGINRNPSATSTPRVDRGDLFRQFIRIVASYDPRLVSHYVEEYSRAHRSSPPSRYLWEAALDLLDSDRAASIRFARAAARGEGFFDASLIYLERLRDWDPGSANEIASSVIRRSATLSANARLEILSYLTASPRVFEIVGGHLRSKDVPGRAAVDSQGVNRALAMQYVDALLPGISNGTPDLFLLALAEDQARLCCADLVRRLAEAELRLATSLPKGVLEGVHAEVSRWSAAPNTLEQSIDATTAAFERSSNEKYRNRGILLVALSRAKAGEYADALSKVSTLPISVREDATDAVLLYAANAITEKAKIDGIVVAARTNTHNRFVVGYCLLAAARLASRDREHTNLASLLLEIEQIAPQLNSSNERFLLRLGAAHLWALTDPVRAQVAMPTLLREIDADLSADGQPFVHKALSIAGTTMEFNIPAGSDSLYMLVRKLALHDPEATLAALDSVRRDDIRLRSMVAACAAYLGRGKEAIANAGKRTS